MADQEPKKKKGPPVQQLPNKQKLDLIGFGTYKLQDQQNLTDLLRKGLQIGYCKHIDTARYYNNQIPLGKAIKTVISQDRCKREDLFIATKSFNHIDSDPVAELKQALRLMQLDYVDLYYLHWPYSDMDAKGEKWMHRSLQDCWARFQECVRKGYAKNLGISNFNGQLITQLFTFCKIKPICLQNEFHPYLWNQGVIDIALKNGIIPFAHTPLARGDSYTGNVNAVKEEVIVDIASKHGKTPAQIILKSILHRKVGVVPKTSNPSRLQENWQAWTVELTQDDMKKIKAIPKTVRICDGKKMFLSFDTFDF